MAAMVSFHAEKCCHLVSEHEASARAYAAVVAQFLIYSTFLLVKMKKMCTHTRLVCLCPHVALCVIFCVIILPYSLQGSGHPAPSRLPGLLAHFASRHAATVCYNLLKG